MRTMPAGAAALPDDLLHVSLTHAVLDPARRKPFDRHVRLVLDRLPGQSGLAAFAARRELIGREVWTMTVWESEAARARFYASDAHREAMREAGDAIVHIRTHRFELRRADLPLDWRRALEVLGPPPWEVRAGAADG